MPSINTLKELLVDELKDLYSAENQLLKALPKMAKAATNEDLKQGFTDHLLQTRGHVERLTEAFKILDEKPTGKTCHAMKGLVEEGAEAIETEGPDAVRDACLIGAAQRVEHYEIAAYGTAHSFAKTVGEDEIAELLEATLAEEGETDKKLSQLSKVVNTAANDEGEEDEDEEEA
jgi:ferritin-like metal-binding protein YciE